MARYFLFHTIEKYYLQMLVSRWLICYTYGEGNLHRNHCGFYFSTGEWKDASYAQMHPDR